jgi:hypothetical protein
LIHGVVELPSPFIDLDQYSYAVICHRSVLIDKTYQAIKPVNWSLRHPATTMAAAACKGRLDKRVMPRPI